MFSQSHVNGQINNSACVRVYFIESQQVHYTIYQTRVSANASLSSTACIVLADIPPTETVAFLVFTLQHDGSELRSSTRWEVFLLCVRKQHGQREDPQERSAGHSLRSSQTRRESLEE